VTVEIKPPEVHPLVTYAAGNVYLECNGSDGAMVLTPDEAWLLGLRLMEGGLYLKQIKKSQGIE
jgi:hypothetical protein